MPRILNAMFSNEARAVEQTQLIRLLTIPIPNNILFLCDTNYNLAFGGQEYVAFPFKLGGISVSTDGTIDKTTLTVANVDHSLIGFLEEYSGLRGIKVRVLTTYSKFLDFNYRRDFETGELIVEQHNPDTANSDAYVEDWFIIDSYTATEQVITFHLDPLMDAGISLPRRRFTPTTCYWRFKGADGRCGYTGTEFTTCDKSLAQCVERGRSLRFGGFPGIPSKVQRIWL